MKFKKFLIAALTMALIAPLPVFEQSGADFSVSSAEAKGGRSSSSRSSSSRSSRPSYSRPKSTPSRSAPKPSYSRPSTSSNKSKPSGSTYSRPGSSSKATGTSGKPSSKYDSGAGKSSAGQKSKTTYTRSTTPKSSVTRTVTDPKTGKKTTQAVKIDRTSPSAKRFSGSSYSSSNYASRGTRQNTVVYNSYYGQSYPSRWGGYNDGISPYFWLYVMSMNSHQQSSYLHNHGSSLDQSRLNELYAKNAQLEAEVNAMKGQPVNANYVPEGMDAANADLMYADDYVAATSGYQAHTVAAQPVKKGWSFLTWVIILSIVGGLIWFVFFRRGGNVNRGF